METDLSAILLTPRRQHIPKYPNANSGRRRFTTMCNRQAVWVETEIQYQMCEDCLKRVPSAR